MVYVNVCSKLVLGVASSRPRPCPRISDFLNKKYRQINIKFVFNIKFIPQITRFYITNIGYSYKNVLLTI